MPILRCGGTFATVQASRLIALSEDGGLRDHQPYFSNMVAGIGRCAAETVWPPSTRRRDLFEMTQRQQIEKPLWRNVTPYAIVFLGLLLGALSVPRGPFVLVVTDPRQPPAHIMDVIGQAGGAFVLAGASPWLAVAYSGKTDFPERLRNAGAVLVLNHILAVGCQAGA